MVPFEKATMRKRSSSTTEYRSAPITISEDDIRVQRSNSMPALYHKTIMRYKTLDESLGSSYRKDSVERKKGDDRRITIASVEIREYGRTIGDNPSCSSGPPISISWEYNKIGEFAIDEYENTKPPRRKQMEMVIPRAVRHDMLRMEWEVSQKDIAEAVRQNVKVKNQRRTTVNNLGRASNMEAMMENVGGKLKRTFSFKKSLSKEVKDLENKHKEANRMRQQQLLEQSMADEYKTDPMSEVAEDEDEVVGDSSIPAQ